MRSVSLNTPAGLSFIALRRRPKCRKSEFIAKPAWPGNCSSFLLLCPWLAFDRGPSPTAFGDRFSNVETTVRGLAGVISALCLVLIVVIGPVRGDDSPESQVSKGDEITIVGEPIGETDPVG